MNRADAIPARRAGRPYSGRLPASAVTHTPEFRTNLQRAHDLTRARESVDVTDIVPLAAC